MNASLRTRITGGLAAALLIAALALAAAACGGDDDGEATPTPGESPTAAGSGTPSDGQTPAPSTPTGTPAITEARMALSEFVIKPDTTRANPGTVIFKVRNEGTIDHQFLVVKTDLGTAELPRRADGKGVDETQIDVVGRTDTITPGAETELSVPMDMGKYVVICNLFSGGKSHYLTGMYNQFIIENVAHLGAPTQ